MDHKYQSQTMTTISAHFCQSRMDVQFWILCEILVENLILSKCVLHFIFPMEYNPIYVMCMVTFDLVVSAQAQTRVDIKQNVFEFRTSFK